MPTPEKAQKIEELTEKLRTSKGAVILDYRGLNVADLSALRRQLSEQEIDFHVAKNTLLRIAAERANVQVAPELLTGPTAIAFGLRDEVSPAKLLTEFARRNRVVQVKGGIVGAQSVNAQEVGRIAELPPREVMLGRLLGVLQAPLATTLGVIQAPAREIAGLALALRTKEEGTQAA